MDAQENEQKGVGFKLNSHFHKGFESHTCIHPYGYIYVIARR